MLGRYGRARLYKKENMSPPRHMERRLYYSARDLLDNLDEDEEEVPIPQESENTQPEDVAQKLDESSSSSDEAEAARKKAHKKSKSKKKKQKELSSEDEDPPANQKTPDTVRETPLPDPSMLQNVSKACQELRESLNAQTLSARAMHKSIQETLRAHDTSLDGVKQTHTKFTQVFSATVANITARIEATNQDLQKLLKQTQAFTKTSDRNMEQLHTVQSNHAMAMQQHETHIAQILKRLARIEERLSVLSQVQTIAATPVDDEPMPPEKNVGGLLQNIAHALSPHTKLQRSALLKPNPSGGGAKKKPVVDTAAVIRARAKSPSKPRAHSASPSKRHRSASPRRSPRRHAAKTGCAFGAQEGGWSSPESEQEEEEDAERAAPVMLRELIDAISNLAEPSHDDLDHLWHRLPSVPGMQFPTRSDIMDVHSRQGQILTMLTTLFAEHFEPSHGMPCDGAQNEEDEDFF